MRNRLLSRRLLFMKHAQLRSRVEPVSITLLYAHRPPAAYGLIHGTLQTLRPECKTARWSTNGAPSYRQFRPYPSAIPDRLHEAHTLLVRDHSLRIATGETDGRIYHEGEARLLAAPNRPQIMSPRKDIPSSRQCPDRCSPLCPVPRVTRETTMVSILTPSLRCPHPFPCG